MEPLPEIIERPLPPGRMRPVRFYDLVHTGGHLAEYVLHVREWFRSDDAEELPVCSTYAVQELPRTEHGWLGRVFLLLRLNDLNTVFKLYDDAEADEGRVFCVRIPPSFGDRRTPGDCDCKGHRTFARCTHFDAMRDATNTRPAQTSELPQTPDADLEAWVLGDT